MKTGRGIVLLLLGAALSFPSSVLAWDSNVIAQIQQSLEDYLAQRGGVETVSAVSLNIDVGGLAAHSHIQSRHLGRT